MEKTLGVYFHIPFCAGKCAYCDFYSKADMNDRIDAYQDALLRHIRESESQLAGYLIDTVYFGGGTPSFYGADRLVELFTELKRAGRVLRDAEVTVEVNPDSVTLQGLQLLRRAGFNRLSIGAQCADDGILKSIGRLHNFSQVETAVDNARTAGFTNVSLDLIYGLPSQTPDNWVDTLTRAVELQPEHLSCYGLKIEEGTPLWAYRDSPFIPDDDTQADMYLYTVEALRHCGYQQYEISNFAKRGFRSRHNWKYWTEQEYFGFGAAAHSYVAGQRYSYVADIDTYIENIQNGGNVVDHSEYLTNYEQAGEYLMLGLRTNEGICEADYCAIYPCDFTPIRKKLFLFIKHGWAIESDGRYFLTAKGFLVSNQLIGEILEAHNDTHLAVPWHKEREANQIQLSEFSDIGQSVRLFVGI